MADAIDEFLGTYSPEVTKTARATRKLLRKLCPKIEEDLQLGWKTVSYGSPTKFCAIGPHTNWVNLQFFEGAHLADPEALLEGTGKSMRHVKLKTMSDVRNDSLKELILEAQARSN